MCPERYFCAMKASGTSLAIEEVVNTIERNAWKYNIDNRDASIRENMLRGCASDLMYTAFVDVNG